MTTNTGYTADSPKKKGGVGKFIFGATLGALVGAVACKLVKDNQDKIEEKLAGAKEGTVVVKDNVATKAREISDKTTEVGGTIAETGKTVKAIAAKTGRKIAHDTMKANAEIKKATKKGIDKIEKTIKNA